MNLQEQIAFVKRFRKISYLRNYVNEKREEINEKSKLKQREKRKDPKVAEYQREYQRKRRAELREDPEYRAKMKKYNHEYGQRPEVKARRKLISHNKWLEHRQKVHNDSSREKLRPNYKYESYCTRCERVRPKGLWCPKCNYRMKNGPTRKKEVHRY